MCPVVYVILFQKYPYALSLTETSYLLPELMRVFVYPRTMHKHSDFYDVLTRSIQ